jgi:hypothetical protein
MPCTVLTPRTLYAPDTSGDRRIALPNGTSLWLFSRLPWPPGVVVVLFQHGRIIGYPRPFVKGLVIGQLTDDEIRALAYAAPDTREAMIARMIEARQARTPTIRIDVRSDGDDGDEVYVVHGDGREECIHSDAGASPEDNIWRRDAGALFQLAFELGRKVGAGEARLLPADE